MEMFVTLRQKKCLSLLLSEVLRHKRERLNVGRENGGTPPYSGIVLILGGCGVCLYSSSVS